MLELILAAALSAAPPVPQAPQPVRVLIPHGAVFECTDPRGCYVANAEGIGEIVRDVAAKV